MKTAYPVQYEEISWTWIYVWTLWTYVEHVLIKYVCIKDSSQYLISNSYLLVSVLHQFCPIFWIMIPKYLQLQIIFKSSWTSDVDNSFIFDKKYAWDILLSISENSFEEKKGTHTDKTSCCVVNHINTYILKNQD